MGCLSDPLQLHERGCQTASCDAMAARSRNRRGKSPGTLVTSTPTDVFVTFCISTTNAAAFNTPFSRNFQMIVFCSIDASSCHQILFAMTISFPMTSSSLRKNHENWSTRQNGDAVQLKSWKVINFLQRSVLPKPRTSLKKRNVLAPSLPPPPRAVSSRLLGEPLRQASTEKPSCKRGTRSRLKKDNCKEFNIWVKNLRRKIKSKTNTNKSTDLSKFVKQ